jgi:hypothetical protein
VPSKKRRQVLQSLPPQEQEELLHSFPPEKLLAALSKEQIRQYLDRQTTGEASAKHKPRRKR